MISNNIILETDSYKLYHWAMIGEKAEHIYSYGEARSGGEYGYVQWLGIQAIIKKHLLGVVVEQWMVDEAKEVCREHLGGEKFLNLDMWQIILDEYGGHLPISIKSAPEGEIIPSSNVLFTITDTDEKGRFASLPNYLESLLMKAWYSSTVATRSYTIVKNLKSYIGRSSDKDDFWKFMLHDFGMRSATTSEACGIGGMAHLVNSLGTDTLPAMRYAKWFYNAPFVGLAYSVPATEHQIPTLYGAGEGEFIYLKDMIFLVRDGIISVVSDTYGVENFIDVVVPRLKEEIIARTKNSDNPLTKVVFRPDSLRFDGDTPAAQVLYIIESLAKTFGYETNSKGYKTLNPCVGVLWGDGITEEEIYALFETIMAAGWSADNLVVGQGGGLLQKLNRDTERFAIKASAFSKDGIWYAICKSPSDQSKASKKGRVKLIKELDLDGKWEYKTLTESHPLFNDCKDELREIFRDGKLLIEEDFATIRNRGLLG